METDKIPHLTPLKKSAGQIRNQQLKNIVTMLTHRGLLDENDLIKNQENIISDHPEDMLYSIKLKNGIMYPIKFIPAVITTIKKPSVIMDFLVTYKNNGGIIIVKEIKQNAHTKLYRGYPLVEVFSEDEMMIDLKNRIDTPHKFYKIINSSDANYEKQIEDFMHEYNAINKKKFPVLKEFDPLAKYLFCKPGDVIKIVRYSTASMMTPYYRIVVKSNLNINTKAI